MAPINYITFKYDEAKSSQNWKTCSAESGKNFNPGMSEKDWPSLVEAEKITDMKIQTAKEKENSLHGKGRNKKIQIDSVSQMKCDRSFALCQEINSQLREAPVKKRYKPFFTNSGIDFENDAVVLNNRLKDVELVKSSDDYINYIEAVSKGRRGPADPWTPNRFYKQSRRFWDDQVKEWKLQLNLRNNSNKTLDTSSYCSTKFTVLPKNLPSPFCEKPLSVSNRNTSIPSSNDESDSFSEISSSGKSHVTKTQQNTINRFDNGSRKCSSSSETSSLSSHKMTSISPSSKLLPSPFQEDTLKISPIVSSSSKKSCDVTMKCLDKLRTPDSSSFSKKPLSPAPIKKRMKSYLGTQPSPVSTSKKSPTRAQPSPVSTSRKSPTRAQPSPDVTPGKSSPVSTSGQLSPGARLSPVTASEELTSDAQSPSVSVAGESSSEGKPSPVSTSESSSGVKPSSVTTSVKSSSGTMSSSSAQDGYFFCTPKCAVTSLPVRQPWKKQILSKYLEFDEKNLPLPPSESSISLPYLP